MSQSLIFTINELTDNNKKRHTEAKHASGVTGQGRAEDFQTGVALTFFARDYAWMYTLPASAREI